MHLLASYVESWNIVLILGKEYSYFQTYLDIFINDYYIQILDN